MNEDYIHLRRFSCGFMDTLTIEGAQRWAANWISKRDAGAKEAGKKLIKSDDPKAVKQRERMRERRAK